MPFYDDADVWTDRTNEKCHAGTIPFGDEPSRQSSILPWIQPCSILIDHKLPQPDRRHTRLSRATVAAVRLLWLVNGAKQLQSVLVWHVRVSFGHVSTCVLCSVHSTTPHQRNHQNAPCPRQKAGSRGHAQIMRIRVDGLRVV